MAIKVKVFKFHITHHCGTIDKTYAWKSSRQEADMNEPLDSETTITRTINAFIKKEKVVNVISLTPTAITIHRHNNGGCDTIDLLYTMVYTIPTF